jgi:hypothetical protein
MPHQLTSLSSSPLSATLARLSQSDGNGEARPPRRNKNAQKNLGWYQLYGNFYKGGRYVFTPPVGTVHPVTGYAISTYLVPHEKETTDEFWIRVRDSFNLPYIKEIITVFTSTLFRQDVVRDPIIELFGADYVADIDLQGHSAREFLRAAFSQAQQYGWVGALTDYPRQTEGYLSAYHESQAQDRPYSRLVQPTRLWDWVRDPATNDFLYAEIWNGRPENEPYELATGLGATWQRWWAPITFQMPGDDGDITVEIPGHWVVVDRDGAQIDGGMHSFPRVPLDILISQQIDADDGLEPFGQSAVSDAAPIAQWIYQMCSLLESHEKRALFAFLHIQEDPQKYGKDTTPDAVEVHLGSSHYLWSPGNVDWVESPPSTPEEARNAIDWGIRQMRRASGVATNSEDSTEAHSGAALIWEHSGRHNMVYERAQNLEDFEARLWRTHAEWLGKEIPPDPIRYPKEYAIQPIDQELDEVDRLIAIGEKLGDTAIFSPMVEQKLRNVAIRSIGHTPRIDDALAAISEGFAKEEELEEGSAAAAEADAARIAQEVEAINIDLRAAEQLVKTKAPDEVIRPLIERVAMKLDILTPAGKSAINEASFRWYTEVQAAITVQGSGEQAQEIIEEQ